MAFDVPYPGSSRQKCDLAIGEEADPLFVECKLLRILSDNGKPNDNMLMHILSPYPQHRSAVADCATLLPAIQTPTGWPCVRSSTKVRASVSRKLPLKSAI